MKNIKAAILMAFLALVPFGSLNAAMDPYPKLDDVVSNRPNVTSVTTATATSGANTGVLDTASVPSPGSSRDINLNIEDIEGDLTEKTGENAQIRQKVEEDESAAGPALLEIDTIRGESPENSSADSSDRLMNSGPVNDWPISVSSRQIMGWDAEKKQEFIVSVKTAAEVRSGQDLENFAKGMLLKDENVDVVEANEETVKITYKMPARFLGIFGTSIATRVEVRRSGNVKVSLPWYAFLFKKLISAGDIASDARASLPEVDDEVLTSFESRARAMMTLSNIMKTKHDTVKNSINNIR